MPPHGFHPIPTVGPLAGKGDDLSFGHGPRGQFRRRQSADAYGAHATMPVGRCGSNGEWTVGVRRAPQSGLVRGAEPSTPQGSVPGRQRS